MSEINKINERKIDFFKKNGFLIIKNIFKKKDLNLIKKRLNFLGKKQKNALSGLSEPGVEKSLIHSLHKDRVFNQIILKNKIINETSKKLINCESIYCWYAKSNLKSKWHGSAEYYHQDYTYDKDLNIKNHVLRSKMIHCMIFVDNHSNFNGGLKIFPGSHKKIYKHKPFLNINSLQKYLIPSDELDKISKRHKLVSVNEKRGSCIFFNTLLVHGSSHNTSPIDRRILLYGITSRKYINNFNTTKVKEFNKKSRIYFEKKELKKRIYKL